MTCNTTVPIHNLRCKSTSSRTNSTTGDCDICNDGYVLNTMSGNCETPCAVGCGLCEGKSCKYCDFTAGYLSSGYGECYKSAKLVEVVGALGLLLISVILSN